MENLDQSLQFEDSGNQGVEKLEVDPAGIVYNYMSSQQLLDSERAKAVKLAPRDINILPSDQESLRRKPEWTEQFRLQRP